MNSITKHFSQVCEALSLIDDQEVQRVAKIMQLVRNAGGTVWLAGNGGSAATASHFANDLSKVGKVKAIAVSDLTPTTLAYGNDEGWAEMFAGVLETHLGPKDVLIGISCSGNSQNIINFLLMGKHRFKIGLTGPGANKIGEITTDVLIRAMADDIKVIEDCHSIICHAIIGALKDG